MSKKLLRFFARSSRWDQLKFIIAGFFPGILLLMILLSVYGLFATSESIQYLKTTERYGQSVFLYLGSSSESVEKEWAVSNQENKTYLVFSKNHLPGIIAISNTDFLSQENGSFLDDDAEAFRSFLWFCIFIMFSIVMTFKYSIPLFKKLDLNAAKRKRGRDSVI